MNTQLSIFDVRTAALARDNGIEKAMKSANTKSLDWSEQAYTFLLDFIKVYGRGSAFMAEQAREYAEKRGLPMPPSKRAWGGIVLRASKAGVIKKIGHAKVKNTDAHCAFASVWQVIDK